MDWARLGLLAVAAAGVTWAAGQIAQRAASTPGIDPPVEGTARAAGTPAPKPSPPAGVATRDAAGNASAGDAMPALDDSELPTPEAVEAELERLEKLLAEEEELAEFTPSKPLPADVPVAWPSDI